MEASFFDSEEAYRPAG